MDRRPVTGDDENEQDDTDDKQPARLSGIGLIAITLLVIRRRRRRFGWRHNHDDIVIPPGYGGEPLAAPHSVSRCTLRAQTHADVVQR
jgi:hypothetical protein